MAPNVATIAAPDVRYPDSDGKRMADNTKQAHWITLLFDNLKALYADEANVFVAADHLIYPVQAEEGEEVPRQAPDVYLVFGRPKGDRGSYQYWREENVPVTVAFEILSPGNDIFEMADKFAFYNEHGIEEYHVYDPDTNRLRIFHRREVSLVRHYQVEDFVSPRMGIRFDLSGTELVVRYPDGRPFVPFEVERQRADAAERRLEQANARLARLIDLGRKARRGDATPEELAELERLEAGTPSAS